MDIYRKDSMATLVKDNAYVGRGIVIGKTADAKKAAVAYFIMGRSENSRNRVFIEKGDEVIIEPFDVSKVEDPSLIIYSPIKKWENKLIVTNGDQTDTVYDFIKDGKTFEEALETREFVTTEAGANADRDKEGHHALESAVCLHLGKKISHTK